MILRCELFFSRFSLYEWKGIIGFKESIGRVPLHQEAILND